MNKSFSIGIMLDSFKIGLKESIKKAKEIGADGIQIYAVSGEMNPENLNKKKRKEMLNYIKDNGLVVSALCGDLGGHGFCIEDENPYKIEKSKKIIELAKDLETCVVTTHIGVIPSDMKSKRYEILQTACNALGSFAGDINAYFAIETGPENPETLKSFLDNLETKNFGVNYDPANLVMVTGADPVEGVYVLKDYIVHTHAKDGIMLKQTNPEIIYNYFAEGGIDNINLNEYFKEVPLGKGHVYFKEYLKALSKIGYHGFLTIEREVGDNPEKDIIDAIEYLRKLI